MSISFPLLIFYGFFVLIAIQQGSLIYIYAISYLKLNNTVHKIAVSIIMLLLNLIFPPTYQLIGSAIS